MVDILRDDQRWLVLRTLVDDLILSQMIMKKGLFCITERDICLVKIMMGLCDRVEHALLNNSG